MELITSGDDIGGKFTYGVRGNGIKIITNVVVEGLVSEGDSGVCLVTYICRVSIWSRLRISGLVTDFNKLRNWEPVKLFTPTSVIIRT